MSTANMFVTVERDDVFFIRRWTGRNAKSIKRAASAAYEKEYPGCDIQFGNVWYVNSYGGH